MEPSCSHVHQTGPLHTLQIHLREADDSLCHDSQMETSSARICHHCLRASVGLACLVRASCKHVNIHMVRPRCWLLAEKEVGGGEELWQMCDACSRDGSSDQRAAGCQWLITQTRATRRSPSPGPNPQPSPLYVAFEKVLWDMILAFGGFNLKLMEAFSRLT